MSLRIVRLSSLKLISKREPLSPAAEKNLNSYIVYVDSNSIKIDI